MFVSVALLNVSLLLLLLLLLLLVVLVDRTLVFLMTSHTVSDICFWVIVDDVFFIHLMDMSTTAVDTPTTMLDNFQYCEWVYALF
jgi:hypothetical protein